MRLYTIKNLEGVDGVVRVRKGSGLYEYTDTAGIIWLIVRGGSRSYTGKRPWGYWKVGAEEEGTRIAASSAEAIRDIEDQYKDWTSDNAGHPKEIAQ